MPQPNRRITSSSLRLAQDEDAMEWIGQLAAILANPNKRVVSILIVDRSGSMKGYQTPVLGMVNEHLEGIKTPADGSDQYCMVITFNDHYRVVVPLAEASTITPLTSYNPQDETLLYKTVYLTLKLFAQAYSRLNPAQRQNLKIVFGIFTDGADNKSDSTVFPAKLVQLVHEARALGFQFYTYGFRFSAKYIAEQMGMPTDSDHALNFQKAPEDFAAASRHFTGETVNFFHASAFRPGRRTTGGGQS